MQFTLKQAKVVQVCALESKHFFEIPAHTLNIAQFQNFQLTQLDCPNRQDNFFSDSLSLIKLFTQNTIG